MENSSNAIKVLTIPSATNGKLRALRDERLNIPEQLDILVSIAREGTDTSFQGRLQNVSKTGLGLSLSEKQIFSENQILDIKILFQNTYLYTGQAKVINSQLKGETNLLGLFLLEENSILASVQIQIDKFIHRDSEIQEPNKRLLHAQEIKSDFKQLSSDLFVYLIDIKNFLESEHEKNASCARDSIELEELDIQTVDLAFESFSPQIYRTYHQFNSIVKGFSNEEHELHKRYFQAIFHSLLIDSPFARRTFDKPLGYAGDYGLMVMLYEYKDLGDNIFDKFYHRITCNEPAALANMNRVEYLSEKIIDFCNTTDKEEIKISSIACGPAKEIELFLQKSLHKLNNKKITINCFDQEGSSLSYSKRRTSQILKDNNDIKVYYYQSDAIIGVIRKGAVSKEVEGSDIIICAGLFDYLSDRVSKKLISAYHRLLSKDGIALIGNVSNQNPSEFHMSYLGDWNLILRSKEDLVELCSELEDSNKKISVHGEELDLNLFLKIEK